MRAVTTAICMVDLDVPLSSHLDGFDGVHSTSVLGNLREKVACSILAHIGKMRDSLSKLTFYSLPLILRNHCPRRTTHTRARRRLPCTRLPCQRGVRVQTRQSAPFKIACYHILAYISAWFEKENFRNQEGSGPTHHGPCRLRGSCPCRELVGSTCTRERPELMCWPGLPENSPAGAT
jgi:hypothetical protein